MPILPTPVRRALLAVAVALALLAYPAAALAIMREGSRGPDVQRLNGRLGELGYLAARRPGARFTTATRYAVMAFQKYAGVGVDGVVGPVTAAVLARAQRPAPPPGGSGRRVAISLASQLAFLVDRHGRARRTISVSTGGSGYETPTGSFTVYRRERRSWSRPYHVWLPWAAYFLRGYALHGYEQVPAQPASHGCVRVPLPFAHSVYSFAKPGTPVVIG